MKIARNFLLVICILCVLVWSCSTVSKVITNRTEPNISALFQIPELRNQLPLLPAGSKAAATEPLPSEAQTLLKQLYGFDSHLALEVGKLPEFQGKVGESQIFALRKFTKLLANATTEDKANLDQFFAVGKPDVRKFSAPLQALFWVFEKMAEDPSYEKSAKNTLAYRPMLAISMGWNFFADLDRWKDFAVVTDRLNSPLLINMYQQYNFTYAIHKSRYECPMNAKTIFATKQGCCRDYTAFAEYCLNKAGYRASAIRVRSPTGRDPYHVVCEYEETGKKYIMDNSAGYGIMEKEKYVKLWPQMGFGYTD
jgi:hypothetical protein